ncbi:MAG TPA: hypothetical protein VE127_10910 [Solirubrobacteraceae bacterium]|nr:hypothetical protein [Solirubrobacteraceae bacterium]
MIEALRGYRNPDGGFGHALEPDLRCPGSQPSPTVYALEILSEAGAASGELAAGARAWLAGIAGPDGSVPAALRGFDRYPHAPWYSAAPGSVLTLALLAACQDGGATEREWLERASDWCWHSIATTERPAAYWLKFALAFLDAAPDDERARNAIASLADRVGSSAIAPVGGGIEGERLRPLDLSPRPGSRSRALVTEAQIEGHLDAVQSEQQADGGWMFDWLAWSPAQTADWRGIVTIRALVWLRDNGRPI